MSLKGGVWLTSRNARVRLHVCVRAVEDSGQNIKEHVMWGQTEATRLLNEMKNNECMHLEPRAPAPIQARVLSMRIGLTPTTAGGRRGARAER